VLQRGKGFYLTFVVIMFDVFSHLLMELEPR
jgi:hypothetical protein